MAGKLFGRLLAPSLLSADFSDLAGGLKKIEDEADIVHFDVMDGVFVPEISFGQVVLRSIRRLSALPFDVHLMIDEPWKKIASFAEAGADWITVHYENTQGRAREIFSDIRSLGKKCGVSIKPATPVSALENLAEHADIILIMTVEPGFGGQKMLVECLDKVRALVRLREERGWGFRISVDGGVNGSTLRSALDSGADIVVSGSAFFGGELNFLERKEI